jgi:DNA polymerase III delta prime subunit
MYRWIDAVLFRYKSASLYKTIWVLEKGTKKYMKKFFAVAIGSIFIYFVLTICRINLAALNNLFTNNMMKVVLIASFTFVLGFMVCLNIKLERKGLYYREHDYLPNRYLVQVIFWIGIVFNYCTGPLHQMHFQGNILSDLFDVAFLCSFISLLLFGVCAIGKCIRKQKERKLKKRKSSETYFYSDNPVSNNRDDKLNRKRFVDHVVSNLYKMKDENLTIGFYGKWGTGKTSIFKMIKETIENENDKKDKYLIFEFKPWYLGKDNHEIVVEFLEQLLNEIKKSRGFDTQIEKDIIKYSKAFSSVSLRIPGITVNFKETYSLTEELFDAKSKNIKDLKDEVEESLRNSPKRIIVFIDDIDRLSKEEIQMVFRLVRLICDFPNITYIVALDEEIVAAALAELHGKDENVDAKKIGRDYLEKFIQIPLYIPETDVYIMNEMLWNGVQEILIENNLLSESRFLSMEFVSTERLIDLQKLEFTPRNINRYLNTVKFMLPLLKDKTNVDDLLYLLLVKVGAPNLYEKIRLEPNAFLEKNIHDDKLIEYIKKKYSMYESLLVNIFPNLIPDSNDIKHASKLKLTENKKRVCSKDYFRRYFMYDISGSERDLSFFMEKLKTCDTNVLSKEFERCLNLYSAEKVFSSIEYSIDKMSETEHQNMIKILQLGMNKETIVTYHLDEYARLLTILCVYLKRTDINPVFMGKIDIKLVLKINDILSNYLHDKEISKILLIEESKVTSFMSAFRSEVKNYYLSSKKIGDLYNDYSIEDIEGLFFIWDNIEEVNQKRIVIQNWINSNEDFEKVLELIIHSQKRKKTEFLARYIKIVELIDIKLINDYIGNASSNNELLNIQELAIKELNHQMETEAEKCMENESKIEYSNTLRTKINTLQKYGDIATKNIINEHEENAKSFNEEIYPGILKKKIEKEEAWHEFLREADYVSEFD